MNANREQMLAIMKKFHEEEIKCICFENKDFEKEVISLFTELFKKEEDIEETFILHHRDESCGLDGGTASDIRNLYKEYYKRFDELKKEHGIND